MNSCIWIESSEPNIALICILYYKYRLPGEYLLPNNSSLAMKQTNEIESVFKLLHYLPSLEKYLIWCDAYCVTELLTNCSSQFRFFINIYVAEQRATLLH